MWQAVRQAGTKPGLLLGKHIPQWLRRLQFHPCHQGGVQCHGNSVQQCQCEGWTGKLCDGQDSHIVDGTTGSSLSQQLVAGAGGLFRAGAGLCFGAG